MKTRGAVSSPLCYSVALPRDAALSDERTRASARVAPVFLLLSSRSERIREPMPFDFYCLCVLGLTRLWRLPRVCA